MITPSSAADADLQIREGGGGGGSNNKGEAGPHGPLP